MVFVMIGIAVLLVVLVLFHPKGSRTKAKTDAAKAAKTVAAPSRHNENVVKRTTRPVLSTPPAGGAAAAPVPEDATAPELGDEDAVAPLDINELLGWSAKDVDEDTPLAVEIPHMEFAPSKRRVRDPRLDQRLYNHAGKQQVKKILDNPDEYVAQDEAMWDAMQREEQETLELEEMERNRQLYGDDWQ